MNEKTKQALLKGIDEGKITDETTLGVFRMVEELNERLDTEIPKITDVIERLKGDKGDSPTKEELLELIEPLIPEVKDGVDADEIAIEARITTKLPDEKKIISVLEKKIPNKDVVVKECMEMMPTKEEIAQEVIIPEPQKIDEQEIVLKVEKNLPQLGEKIRDGLELLSGDDRLDKSAIKNLVEELKELRELAQRSRPVSGGGRNPQIVSEEPTGTVDGANDTFYLSTNTKKNSLILIWSGSFQRPLSGHEYELTGKKIVFYAGSVPTTGALWAHYTKF